MWPAITLKAASDLGVPVVGCSTSMAIFASD
jgi:hypothetical protein